MDDFRRRQSARSGAAKNEIAPGEENIPEGWPRPYYRTEGDSKTRKYAQWSSDLAAAQVTSCNPDRTYAGGEHHLCSSCGAQMSKGLIFDSLPLIEKGMQDKTTVAYEVGVGHEQGRHIALELRDLDGADTHYGSPICFRCAVFAAKHCPYLAALHEPFGDDFLWFVTTSGQDYREFDETSGLEVIDPEALAHITTGEVRTAVQRGDLHLTGRTAKDFTCKRPSVLDESGRFYTDARRDPTEETLNV